MSASDSARDLLAAFDAASGREVAAPGAIDRDVLALAGRLVALGRVIVVDPPCPTPWVRRAEALFVARRPSAAAALWSILFDSSRSASPAARGAARTRFLRVGGDGGSIEAEIRGIGSDDVRLVGALEGPTRATTIVLAPSVGATARATVTDAGTFELPVPSGATSFSLSIQVGRRIVATSETIELAAGGRSP